MEIKLYVRRLVYTKILLVCRIEAKSILNKCYLNNEMLFWSYFNKIE